MPLGESKERSMWIRSSWLIPLLAVAALLAAPSAAADNSEFCTTLTTSATKCQRQGDVEVNDSLARSNTLPQWSSAGQQSGGPYGGTLGGGSR
jgi:hypothetical protein